MIDFSPTDHPAITESGVTYTYRDLHRAVDDRACHLRATGLAAGDVVALIATNGIGFAVDLLAVHRAGMIAAPVNPALPAARIDDHLGYIGAAASITSAGTPAGQSAGIVLRGPGGRRIAPHPQLHPDTACLPMSSGTTGTAKAVMLSANNLAGDARLFAAAAELRRSDTVISALPFTHIYGLTVLLLSPLSVGAHIIAEPFHRERFVGLHTTYEATVSFIAPPLADLFTADATSDFSSLRLIVSGAAALNPATAAALHTRTGARVAQGYGLTEASPVTHFARSAQLCPPDTVGHALPGTCDRIADPATGESVPDGSPGELWVKGPQVMLGYLGDSSATAAALSDDGWLRTGDLAVKDPGGVVRIVDRIKDVIKYHGYSVSPVKVEQILSACPGVADAAVVKGYDGEGEEIPVAVIAPDPEHHPPVTDDRLLSFSNRQLAHYEQVRAIVRTDRIPRTATGKIDRTALAARLGNNTGTTR
ncbi:class I adenylate-forming enzyme family protein [Corynebacterium mendelii]|uniref:Acyl--CoA ligase n=1 Tax=Corynebacterium mendelii TaxID=2765362 RepID=A0A939E259_9CORY|nr:acyl--CoA ligase [Corynebacterium mendelii]